MSIFGAANAPVVNQQIQQAAKAAREGERKRPGAAAPGAVRGEDEVDLELTGSAGDEAVRSLKGNSDQETADDREQQDHYTAPPESDKDKPKRPSIDLQG